MKFLAKGRRSIVYLISYGNKKAVLKQETRNLGVLKNEANFLKLLNKHKIGPKLLSDKNNKLILEYVKGIPLLKYIETSNSKKIKKVIKEIFNQCYSLDQLKINKHELTNPYKDILVAKKPVMIDFERARFTDKPKNVTQFSQFLISKNVISRLNKKVDRNKLIKLLREYKYSQSYSNFKKIVSTLT